MRILHINAIHEEKSTGRICKEISSVALAHGHESVVAYATGPDTGSGFRIGSSLDQKRHAFLSRLSGKQGYFSKGTTVELIDFIESYKPDVVHLHNLHSNYIHLDTLFNWLSHTDTPTVLTLHDCWFYTGKCTHYTRTGCERWRDGCGSCPRLKLDNPSWGLDRTAEMWHDKQRWFENISRLAVIGVSDWITMEARFSLLGNAKVIQRIHNWVDLDIFYPRDTSEIRAALGFENRFILLGVASSWDDSKGLSDFLKVARALPEARLLLVGDISDIRLPVNVIHIPSTNRIEELADYYALADVFLNLSVEESFGKVTAEAMASGTPVVVLDATANPELVPSTCGEVVAPDHMEDILGAIEKIRRLGKEHYADSCVEHARSSFSMEERVMDYLYVYESLVHDKRRNLAWNVPSSQSSSPFTMERTI